MRKKDKDDELLDEIIPNKSEELDDLSIKSNTEHIKESNNNETKKEDNNNTFFSQTCDKAYTDDYRDKCNKRRKARLGAKALHLRKTKNFIFVMIGFFLAFVILIGVTYTGAKVVPIKDVLNFVGVNNEQLNGYVSNDVASKSLIDAVSGYGSFTVADFPLISDNIDQLLELEITHGIKVGDVLTIDEEKFNALSLSNIGDINQCISADLNKLAVNDFIDESSNTTLYKILRDATSTSTGDITLEKLSNNFDFENIKFLSILESSSSNQKLYDILLDLTGKSSYEELTLQSITNIDFDTLRLSKLISETGNEKIFSLLRDSLQVNSNDEITIHKLTSTPIEIDNIFLSSVLENNNENKLIYNILTDITEKDNTEITIGDLSNLDSEKINNIKIKSIITPTTDNEGLFNVLLDQNPSKNIDTMTVGDFYNFKMNDVLFRLIVSAEQLGSNMVSILNDITEKDFSVLTVGDLTSISTGFGNIKLIHIINYNETNNGQLFSILCEATGKADTSETSRNSISITDITDNFNIGKVSIGNVMDVELSSNAILKALPSTTKLSDLGTAVNDLSIYNVFGKSCFAKISDIETENLSNYDTTVKYSFNSSLNTYSLDSSGNYYRLKVSGIWLVISFDATVNTSGIITVYKANSITVGDLQDNSISSTIMDSKLAVLLEAGLFTNTSMSASTKQKSLKEILEIIP